MESLSAQGARILDFDSSVTGQKDLLAKYNQPGRSLQIIDLLEYGPAARLWIGKQHAQELCEKIPSDGKNKITLYGSGDFHHISTLLMDKFEEDFCAVIFDMHPDLDNTFPKFSCGSWVNLIARKPSIKKIVMIGPSSEDLSFPHNMTFNFSYFKDGRVEIYPFYHEPSITASGRIVWDNLRDKDIKQFMAGIISRLPSKNIYISIDKDCLKRDYAVTNWEEGPITLDWLLDALRVLRDNANIIGMDITGDYSPITSDSMIKRICAAWDHPGQYARKMSREEITRINEATNLKILELFLK